MPSGAPSGNIGAGEGGGMQPGSPGGALDQPAGPDGASKGSTTGAAGDAMKEPKGSAGAETGMSSDRKAGTSEGDKAGSTAEGKTDTKSGMSKDDKAGATAEGKDDMSKDGKSGATAEGKDGKAKDGKSARLELKDISKVRVTSGITSRTQSELIGTKFPSRSASHCRARSHSTICPRASLWSLVPARSSISCGMTMSCWSIRARAKSWRSLPTWRNTRFGLVRVRRPLRRPSFFTWGAQ